MNDMLDTISNHQAKKAVALKKQQHNNNIDDMAKESNQRWAERIFTRIESINQQQINRGKRQAEQIEAQGKNRASASNWKMAATDLPVCRNMSMAQPG